MEFFICNPDDVEEELVQDCFNQNPLTRAAQNTHSSPIDPDFPGRFYVVPPCDSDNEESFDLPHEAQAGYVMHATYQLPQGLVCEHCILQMVYCELWLGLVWFVGTTAARVSALTLIV